MQGPKFVSDEEIERIKAKIEEDNRAIAALDIKKFGEIEKHKKIFSIWMIIIISDPYVPRTTTIPGYGSPSLDSKHTIISELRSEVSNTPIPYAKKGDHMIVAPIYFT